MKLELDMMMKNLPAWLRQVELLKDGAILTVQSSPKVEAFVRLPMNVEHADAIAKMLGAYVTEIRAQQQQSAPFDHVDQDVPVEVPRPDIEHATEAPQVLQSEGGAHTIDAAEAAEPAVEPVVEAVAVDADRAVDAAERAASTEHAGNGVADLAPDATKRATPAKKERRGHA